MESSTKVKMEPAKPRKIRDFNEIFTCYLCDGYMIDPTAVDICGHAFCRSCILKYLMKSAYCPQCGSDSKPINAEHLRPDDAMRSLIYKMMPNVYQSEKQRQTQFYTSRKRHSGLKFEKEALNRKDIEENFFTPAEPISLSLEYHPALLEDCQDGEIPPIRYLQCPASVQIQHLKRFLYSKFALDPQNDRIAIEIIYEEEILPDNFMLMDVGYCYDWKREAPMRFMYRVMVYEQPPLKLDPKISDSNDEPKSKSHKNKTITQKSPKSVTFAEEATVLEHETRTTKVKKNSKIVEAKIEEENLKQAPAAVKVVIARKPAQDTRKPSSKRSHAHRSNSMASGEEPAAPTNDFKSLRSNDIRFSDYTVTTTTTAAASATTNSKTKTGAALAAKANTTSKQQSKSTAATSPPSAGILPPQASAVPIVVSIPQSQVVNSPYAFDEQVDNLSLAQLKSACKKSPNFLTNSTKPQTDSGTRNVPKLKIELSTLKTKISIPKPKSAEVLRNTTSIEQPTKKAKHRKHSLDECSGPITGKVDLETYAKNIGLKPIEVVTPSLDDGEKSLKYSPNASPRSSCSSSTTSSSNSNFPAFGDSAFNTSSSSSHKKHKKKHSRESREPKEGKRRKLHAEISSQPADESLKMKVKITTTTSTHSHKSHKSKTTPPSTPNTAAADCKISITPPKSPPKIEQQQQQPVAVAAPTVVAKVPSTDNLTASAKSKQSCKSEADINIVALNKALGEEALSIKKLMRGEETETNSKSQLPTRQPTLLPKQVTSNKELPTSPPLPPSLFKTTPSTFTTNASSSLKTTLSVSKPNEAPKPPRLYQNFNMPPTTKTQTFAVPTAPPRSKYMSAPSSIASAANKQAASLLQLKRAASSNDDANNAILSKQQCLEQDRLLRKSIYGPAVGNNALTSMPNPYPPLMTSLVLPQQRALTTTPAISSPPLNITKFNDAILKSAGLLPPATLAAPPLDMPRKSALSNFTQAQLNLLAASTALQRLPLRFPTTAPATIDAMPLLPPAPIPPPTLSLTKAQARLMGPPISVANKVKKPAPLSPSTMAAIRMYPFSAAATTTTSTSVSSTAGSASNTNSSKKVTFRSSPPALINFRNAPPLKPTAVKSALATPQIDTLKLPINADESKTSNGISLTLSTALTQGKAPLKSLREFRPISKDNSVDILDLSGGKSALANVSTAATTTTATTSAATNSLEAALNKVKQSIATCTVTTIDKSPNSATSTTTTARADDLQNLHLLSESATAREKILLNATQPLISATAALTNALTSSYFDKSKQPPSTLVRHQNASVRNIPNPSALAFRNQPQTQMQTTTATTTPTAAAAATIENSTATSQVKSNVNRNETTTSTAKTDVKSTPTSTVNTSTATPTTKISTTTVATHRPTKKLTTIDQVAATLNIRAAAAVEASAARAASVAATAATQDDKNDNQRSKEVTTKIEAEVKAATIETTTTAASKSTATTNAADSTPVANVVANKINSIKQADKSVTPSSSLTALNDKTSSETSSTVTNQAATIKQTTPILNNNNINNNNTSSSDNNNKTNANNNNNNSNSNKNNNNNIESKCSNLTTPATKSAPLSTPLSLVSPSSSSLLSLSSSLLSSSSSSPSSTSASESNQTGLVAQGSV